MLLERLKNGVEKEEIGMDQMMQKLEVGLL